MRFKITSTGILYILRIIMCAFSIQEGICHRVAESNNSMLWVMFITLAIKETKKY